LFSVRLAAIALHARGVGQRAVVAPPVGLVDVCHCGDPLAPHSAHADGRLFYVRLFYIHLTPSAVAGGPAALPGGRPHGASASLRG